MELEYIAKQRQLLKKDFLDEMSDDEVQSVFDASIIQNVIDMEGGELDESKVEALGYMGGEAEHIDMKKEKKKVEANRILPFYTLNKDGKKYYIVTVRGNGLWDEIWGNIALEEDFNTIVGASFDHQGETPGLGAEIKDNPAFSVQFIGKKIYEGGKYVGVTVRKGGAQDPNHEVDGISGATITADGVTEMVQRGIQYYEPYFEKLKASKAN